MKFKCLFLSAILSSSLSAWEGSGYTILSSEVYTTPGIKAGMEILPTGTLSSAQAGVSVNDAHAKKNVHFNLDGWHGVFIRNETNSPQIYKVSLAIYCPPGQYVNVNNIRIEPQGFVRQESHSYLDGFHEYAGNYVITGITNIEGVTDKANSFERLDRTLFIIN